MATIFRQGVPNNEKKKPIIQDMSYKYFLTKHNFYLNKIQ